VVEAATDPVATLKLAPESPTFTVTLEGTEASAESLVRVTTVAAVAIPLRTTRPCAGVRPVTLPGFTVTAERLAPTPAVRERVTLEPAAIETLSCIWPP
jgi:hypothetical protein